MKTNLKKIMLIIVCILNFSCATITLKKYQKTKIETDDDKIEVYINKKKYKNNDTIKLKRSKEIKIVKLKKDSIEKIVLLKPKLNNNFIFGNLYGIPLFGFTYLIDFTNPKRFEYGRKVKINFEKEEIKTFKYLSENYNGQKNINISINPISSSYVEENNNENYTGIINGIGFGFESFNKHNKYINYYIGISRNLTFSEWGIYSNLISLETRVTNNHVLKNFHLGYGANYSLRRVKNRVCTNCSNENNKVYDTYYTFDFGILFNSFYRIGENTLLGINYSPLRINTGNKLKLKSTFNIELKWCFDLTK